MTAFVRLGGIEALFYRDVLFVLRIVTCIFVIGSAFGVFFSFCSFAVLDLFPDGDHDDHNYSDKNKVGEQGNDKEKKSLEKNKKI